jgi:hypothetical protein
MQASMSGETVASIQTVDQQPSGTELSRKIIEQPKRAGPETQARAGSERQPGLVPGSAVYQIPSPMVENQSSPVDLWIDASMTVDDLSAQLKRFLIENVNRAAKRSGQPMVKSKSFGTTQIVGKEVLIGRKMYAELTGPDFEIQPPGLQQQAYIEGRSLRWSWLVKPKRASEDGLPLEIRVMADPGEGQTPVETIREVVVVHARKQSWKEIFEQLDWWIKLLGGGGVGAIVVWLFNWLFLHRGSKSGRKRKRGSELG